MYFSMYLFKSLQVWLYLLIGGSSIIVMDYPTQTRPRNTIGTSIFRPDLKQNYQINEFHSAF